MSSSRRSITWGVIVALICATVLAIVVPNWHWYRSAAENEAHLATQTPQGSSESEVQAYLEDNAVSFTPPWRGPIEPSSEYSPSSVAGSSLIRALVGEYTVVFVTSVEAYYVFDADRRLVGISVRKTTDAL